MIVRPKVNWLRMLFVWNGSVLQSIIPPLDMAPFTLPGIEACQKFCVLNESHKHMASQDSTLPETAFHSDQLSRPSCYSPGTAAKNRKLVNVNPSHRSVFIS